MDRTFQLLPDQASTIAPKVDALSLYILGVTIFFTLLILVLVAYFALRYRRLGKDIHLPNPPDVHTSTALEIVWSGIPLVLVMIMFVWSAKLFIESSQPPDGAEEVHVIGKQWMWKIQHADGRREINELTVPIGRPIKLVMTSQDVIHDFGLPACRIKQDVLPGRFSYEWFNATKVGDYHITCNQYCGAQHSAMIGVVHVLTTSDYQRWLSGTAPAEQPEVAGAELFFNVYKCAYCHAERAPSMAGLYGTEVPVLEGDRRIKVKVNEDYLRESILYPRAKIAIDPNTNQPYPADLMPGFQGQMTEEQLYQLIAYIKSLGQGAGPGAGGQRMDPGIKMREENPTPRSLNRENSDQYKR
jgi:cytochrome c oxidase subunit 2